MIHLGNIPESQFVASSPEIPVVLFSYLRDTRAAATHIPRSPSNAKPDARVMTHDGESSSGRDHAEGTIVVVVLGCAAVVAAGDSAAPAVAWPSVPPLAPVAAGLPLPPVAWGD